MKYSEYGELCVALLQAEIGEIAHIAVSRQMVRALIERVADAEELEEEIETLHAQLEGTRKELNRELEGT